MKKEDLNSKLKPKDSSHDDALDKMLHIRDIIQRNLALCLASRDKLADDFDELYEQNDFDQRQSDKISEDLGNALSKKMKNGDPVDDEFKKILNKLGNEKLKSSKHNSNCHFLQELSAQARLKI